MGLRESDSFRISVAEWNRKEIRRYMRDRALVIVAGCIVGSTLVACLLYFLHESRIINLLRW